jgi:hypothetical protein
MEVTSVPFQVASYRLPVDCVRWLLRLTLCSRLVRGIQKG